MDIRLVKFADYVQQLEREAYQGIFYIEVFKRGNKRKSPGGTNELRVMRCKLTRTIKSKKYIKGKGDDYDPAAYALLWVCDMDIAGKVDKEGNVINPLRSINLNGVRSATIKGRIFVIIENKGIKVCQ